MAINENIKDLKQDLRRAKLDKEKSLKDFEYYSKEVILLEEAIRDYTLKNERENN